MVRSTSRNSRRFAVSLTTHYEAQQVQADSRERELRDNYAVRCGDCGIRDAECILIFGHGQAR
jgi:hypothetical protein